MPITYKFQEGSESLSSHTGLGLAGALLERTELKDRLSNVELPGCKDPVIGHSDLSANFSFLTRKFGNTT